MSSLYPKIKKTPSRQYSLYKYTVFIQRYTKQSIFILFNQPLYIQRFIENKGYSLPFKKKQIQYSLYKYTVFIQRYTKQSIFILFNQPLYIQRFIENKGYSLPFKKKQIQIVTYSFSDHLFSKKVHKTQKYSIQIKNNKIQK